MTVPEVSVLGDDHPVLVVGPAGDLGVGRLIAVGQVESVDGVATGFGKPSGQSNRELRVDEELHAPPSGATRRKPVASAATSSAAEQIVAFEVRVRSPA